MIRVNYILYVAGRRIGPLSFMGDVGEFVMRMRTGRLINRRVRGRGSWIVGTVFSLRGPGKSVNEDSGGVAVARVGDSHYGVAVVADGVSSLPNGHLASARALLCSFAEIFAGISDGRWSPVDVFDRCHQEVVATGGATTLSMALAELDSGRVLMGAVGDSMAIYITKSGVYYTQMQRAGGKAITQALGHPTYRGPLTNSLYLDVPSLLVVASDGVHDLLPSGFWERDVPLEAQPRKLGMELIKMIGGRLEDDATAAILRVR